MSLRLRVVLLILVLAIVAALGAVHWLVSHVATPNYTQCRGRTLVLLTGFGRGEQPRVSAACIHGEVAHLQVRAHRDSGEVVLDAADASLLQLDGVRQPGHVAVAASTVDHSSDVWWARLAEAMTPFTDLDPTSAYGSTEESKRHVELGQPRATATSSGSRLTIELGSHLDDESLSVLVAARDRS